MKRARLFLATAAAPVTVATLALAPAGAVEVVGGRQDAVGRPAGTLREIADAIRACWTVPPGLRLLERVDVAVRFSLKRDGSAAEQKRITFIRGPADEHARAILARSALDAVTNCTPVPLTAGLGGAVAGRPFTIRFIHAGPAGRGT